MLDACMRFILYGLFVRSNWFENPLCRLPGELTTQFPLNCPADFVFDMNKLYALEVCVEAPSVYFKSLSLPDMFLLEPLA